MKVLLLTGGSGTRLWPLSRKGFPKQFLRMGGVSLLRETAERLLTMVGPDDVVVLTNEEYRFHVIHELEGTGISRLVLEPLARNTAPAIALGVAYCREVLGCDPHEPLFVSPSDHHVEPGDAFVPLMPGIESVVKGGSIVTFGISPDRPETGYGYIEIGEPVSGAPGFFNVKGFTEKPDESTARCYLDSGRFLWNSGMFAFTISTITAEFERWLPQVGKLLVEGYQSMLRQFHRLASISIDYAVMERSDRIVTLPLKVQWSDVGSWDSLFEVLPMDGDGNVVKGDVLPVQTSDSLMVSQGRLLVTVGMKDAMVVETPDAVLVARRGEGQQVREAVERLAAQGRPEVEQGVTVFRPWGSYTVIEEGEGYKVKKVLVRPGQRLSLQRHSRRSEHWVVVKGEALVTVGEKSEVLRPNQSTYVPVGAVHRLENTTANILEIIEVQVGEYLGEDDIERLDDAYGRD